MIELLPLHYPPARPCTHAHRCRDQRQLHFRSVEASSVSQIQPELMSSANISAPTHALSRPASTYSSAGALLHTQWHVNTHTQYTSKITPNPGPGSVFLQESCAYLIAPKGSRRSATASVSCPKLHQLWTHPALHHITSGNSLVGRHLFQSKSPLMAVLCLLLRRWSSTQVSLQSGIIRCSKPLSCLWPTHTHARTHAHTLRVNLTPFD